MNLLPEEVTALRTCASRLGSIDNDRNERGSQWIVNKVLATYDPAGELALTRTDYSTIYRCYTTGDKDA